MSHSTLFLGKSKTATVGFEFPPSQGKIAPMPTPTQRLPGKLPRLPEDPPDSFLLDREPLSKTEAPIWRELRIMLAAKLYGAGRISSERSAKLAGSPHIEFLLTLGFYKVFPLLTELLELEQEAHGQTPD